MFGNDKGATKHFWFFLVYKSFEMTNNEYICSKEFCLTVDKKYEDFHFNVESCYIQLQKGRF